MGWLRSQISSSLASGFLLFSLTFMLKLLVRNVIVINFNFTATIILKSIKMVSPVDIFSKMLTLCRM